MCTFHREPQNDFAAFFEGRFGGTDSRDPARDVVSMDFRDPARVAGGLATSRPSLPQSNNQYISYGR